MLEGTHKKGHEDTKTSRCTSYHQDLAKHLQTHEIHHLFRERLIHVELWLQEQITVLVKAREMRDIVST